MGVSKAIKHIMIEKDFSIKELAERYGVTYATMRNKLSREKYQIDDFLRILNILDAEMVIKDKQTGTEYPIKFDTDNN